MEEDFTGDLGEVVNGVLVGRENDKEIIVFETVGVPLRIWWFTTIYKSIK